MNRDKDEGQDSNLPNGLANPARRALTAGYSRLEQLSRASVEEIKHLHGIGPKAIAQLRSALQEVGLSFADE